MSVFKKKKPNNCYTYFRIVGDFDPDNISQKLDLQPFEVLKKNQQRKNGTKYDFSAWHFGQCNIYNIDTACQMEETIQQLKNKVNILNDIQREYDVSFYLEIVPCLFSYNTKPTLSPSLDVIDFCHATRTEIDIDLYIYE